MDSVIEHNSPQNDDNEDNINGQVVQEHKIAYFGMFTWSGFKKRLGITQPLLHMRPSWNSTFATIIKTLRVAANTVPRNVRMIRRITDHSIPTWLPTIPPGVRLMNETTPCGEWFYPAASGRGLAGQSDSKGPVGPGIFILYIHGGAFCVCNSATHRGLLTRIVHKTRATIFSLNYRRPPEFPFPAPVDDCVAAYTYLLSRLTPTDRVFIAGDSAGGNLAIATLMRIYEDSLPRPTGAVLLSPWVDLTDIGVTDSWTRYKVVDYLPVDLAKLFAECYRGVSAAGIDESKPSVSSSPVPGQDEPEGCVWCDVASQDDGEDIVPAKSDGDNADDTAGARNIATIDGGIVSASTASPAPPMESSRRDSDVYDSYWHCLSPLYFDNLQHMPPTLVEFGECEVLHDQILNFCLKLERAGVPVIYNARFDMVHVFPIYAFSEMPQCLAALDTIARFIQKTT